MSFKYLLYVLIMVMAVEANAQSFYTHDEFCMGADLSYVNHIGDKGADWRENGESVDPYKLFAGHGGNCVRLRIWHNPDWTKQVYIDAGKEATQLYHDFYDVKEAIRRSKEQGLAVCLDFHYSDTWADPGNQIIPKAWEGLTFNQVKDSIYVYTFRVLSGLDVEGLMPEYVQVGNEINPGFLFPHGRLSSSKTNLAILLNQAIKAVKDAGAISEIMPKTIIHVAQPQNVEWWFDQMIPAGLSGFDIIGFSYYPRWSDVPIASISDYVAKWKNKFGKDVMCVETSYLWKTFGSAPTQDEISQMEPNYYASVSGQKKYFIDLTQEIIDGGGKGMMPWEPFWVQGHDMINAWGTVGESWGNRSFFDFTKGNEVNPSIDYMNYLYSGISSEIKISDSVDVGILLNVQPEYVQGNDFYIQGTFSAGGRVKMEKTGETTFLYQSRLPEKSFQVYRFYRGGQPETVPEIYRVGNTTNRAFSVPSSDTIFNQHWQYVYQAVDSVRVTFRVNMEGYTVQDEGMYIYGQFYDTWGPRLEMEKVGENLYAKTLTLLANSEVYFRFFNGFDWGNTETIPNWCRYGDYNRIFPTPGFDATYDFVYNVCEYQLCDTCGQATLVLPYLNEKEYRLIVNEENHTIQTFFPDNVNRILVMDVWGRKIAGRKVSKLTNLNLNSSGWKPGIYIIVFNAEDESIYSRKFVLKN
ncbi:MAG: glycosyl hydrolase 53 family protein [Mariniphaga sp.]|nr:glycosyl hydrolase 53 family protein [Mariniphaga sp.]